MDQLKQYAINGWRDVTKQDWPAYFHSHVDNALEEVRSLVRCKIITEESALKEAYRIGMAMANEIENGTF